MANARFGFVLTVCATAATLAAAPQVQDPNAPARFSFRTSVELINVTATVTDTHGRFVPNLKADDFEVYEDGVLQTLQQFDADRVPVSLGIAIDTSGSMLGEKIAAAQAALHRFLFDLLGAQDEVFLYRFDGKPELVQGWTTDRGAVARALGSVKPSGGTAIFDTVAEAVPLAQSGTRRKKALVIISDGNDTSSRTRATELSAMIRQSEVLVYAIGIDASEGSNYAAASTGAGPSSTPVRTIPVPSPFPGKAPTTTTASRPAPGSASNTSTRHNSPSSKDRLNVDTLRSITDESGGRTEIVVSPRDLDPATAGIADELSRQYFLGYSSQAPKDGKWHTIDVRLKKPGTNTVRARKGFVK